MAIGNRVQALPRWSRATVVGARRETATARTLRLDVAGWRSHAAGQHVDVRLTASDGYQATRSYSLSSADGDPPEITVERVDGGEVSPYLVDVAERGDGLEVLGPIGGYFVWEAERASAPLLLVAGGSGIAPLRAIRASARSAGHQVHLVYSARTRARLIFADELSSARDVTITFTREDLAGPGSGRLTVEALAEYVTDGTCAYVCGPTAFVEGVAQSLIAAGLGRSRLRTERFG